MTSHDLGEPKKRIVIWIDHSSTGRVRWCFRGISGDGTYYGEAEDHRIGRGYHRNIEGRLSPSDNERFQRLSQEIEESHQPFDATIGRGLLTGFMGSGDLSDPRVLIRYVQGDESRSVAATKFLELIGQLRPIAESFLDGGD